MKIHLNKIKIIVLIIVVVFSISITTYRIGYYKGYNTGAFHGVKISLDTVKTIIEKQFKSDCCVTKLILINPDTNTYILSPKTVRIKD